MSSNSIDINQRIPLDVLEIGLRSFLEGSFDDSYITEQLQFEFNGENRIKKALRIVKKIIQDNPMRDFLMENKEAVLTALRIKKDRNIILIALLNSSFPFSFDVLLIFGKFFKIQEIVSTEAIKKPIAGKYGGNRAMENGLYSVIPMFLEASFFNRPKQGIYVLEGKLKFSTGITEIIYKESFKINKFSSASLENFGMEPYFVFLDFQN
jgi:hypothetical protein